MLLTIKKQVAKKEINPHHPRKRFVIVYFQKYWFVQLLHIFAFIANCFRATSIPMFA